MNIIDFFFPRQCIQCKQIGAYLCKRCKKNIQPHPEICPYCHKYSQDYKTCFDCKIIKENCLEGIIIPFKYTALIKKLILKLKYNHKKDVTDFLIQRIILAIQANQTLQRQFTKNATLGTMRSTLISYIPSHWYRKYFVKGYNQSELLAKQLTTQLQKEQDRCIFEHILEKKKHTKSQAKLDRSGRLKNLKTAFSIKKNTQIQGDEHIILIDDVTTTGSTLNQTAKIIKKIYPNTKIRGIVIARHHG